MSHVTSVNFVTIMRRLSVEFLLEKKTRSSASLLHRQAECQVTVWKIILHNNLNWLLWQKLTSLLTPPSLMNTCRRYFCSLAYEFMENIFIYFKHCMEKYSFSNAMLLTKAFKLKYNGVILWLCGWFFYKTTWSLVMWAHFIPSPCMSPSLDDIMTGQEDVLMAGCWLCLCPSDLSDYWSESSIGRVLQRKKQMWH